MSKRFLNPINLVNLPSDPSTGSEGDIYYNTTLDIARIYVNGAWQDLGAGVTYTDEEAVDAVAVSLDNGTHSNVSVVYDDATNAISLSTTGNVSNIDSIVYPDYITFDTTPETIPTESGSIFWDSGDGIPATILNPNVTIGIGQESVALVKNATGSSIAKGKVVYINGAQGQRPTIALSDADTESTSSKTFGFTAETIADGAEGFIVTEGVLRGINTAGLTEGGAIWLSSTAGGFTQTLPTQPVHGVFLGYVVKAHASSGEVFVKIQNGYELNELHNVLINGTDQDQVLRYDETSGLWKNTHPNVITAKNATESTIPAFTPVYINTQEFDQNNVTFAPADAATSMYLAKLPADAITTTSVATNALAKLVTTGIVSGMDLTGYNLGDLLYVGVGGGLTSTRPTGTNAIQPFARVLSTDNGTIYVYGNTFASSIQTLPNLETNKVWLGTSGRPVETTLNTSVVSEGTNLYFTDERAQDAASTMISSGAHNGISVEYVDSSGIFNFTNTGVTALYGTTNEIEVSGSTGGITISIPDSPVFVTPNIGVATATSVNGTTIPSSKTLVITDDIGSTVQGYSSTLAGINTLGSGTGLLRNTSGTWSYDSSTYLTTSDASSTYLTQSNASSTYLTQSTATSTYQPLDQDLTDIAALTANGFLKKTAGVWAMDTSTYLTSYTETDTLSSVTGRGATTSDAISISNTTQSTTPTSGALIISGGVGIAKDVWIDGDLHVNGTTITENTQTVATHDNLIYLNAAEDTTITNVVGDGTYVTYTADNNYTVGMDIRVTGMDPSGYNISYADGLTVYSATSTQFVVEKTDTGTFVSGGIAHAKEEANPDLGFAGGYYSFDGYAHAGLFRDASDGVFKFFKGYTPEPDEAVDIDTTHASFALAPISAAGLKLYERQESSYQDGGEDFFSYQEINHLHNLYNGVEYYRYALDNLTTSLPFYNITSTFGRTSNSNSVLIEEYNGYDSTHSYVLNSHSVSSTTIIRQKDNWTPAGGVGSLIGKVGIEMLDYQNITIYGTLNLENALSYTEGGTGLTTLGTAGQVLTVNAGATALEWADGGSGAGTIVSTTPPGSPVEGMGWFDNGNGKLYIYDGTFWVEASNNLNDEAVMDIVATMINAGTHNNLLIEYSDLTNALSFNVLSEPITDFLTLNPDVTGTPSINAGVAVNRGDLADVAIRWNETEDQWEYTNDGAEYQSIGSGGGAVSTMTALSNSFWLGA